MNPAEDVLLYGDELCVGMWVLPPEILRGRDEDRSQQFRKITKLRDNVSAVFIAQWDDGYQEQQGPYSPTWAWIVKRDSIPVSTEDE